MISKCGWDMKKTMRVRFLFVQPGVVSTCSVTERVSFVNSFAAVFREGVFGVRLDFSNVGAFSMVCGVVTAGFLDRVWCAIFSRTPRLRFSTLTVL